MKGDTEESTYIVKWRKGIILGMCVKDRKRRKSIKEEVKWKEDGGKYKNMRQMCEKERSKKGLKGIEEE